MNMLCYGMNSNFVISYFLITLKNEQLRPLKKNQRE